MISTAIVAMGLASLAWAQDTPPGSAPAKSKAPAKAAPRAAALSVKPIPPPEPLPKGEKVARAKLELDPRLLSTEFNRRSLLMSYPATVTLSGVRPPLLKKEPAYLAKPVFGTIALGEPSKPGTILVIDENSDESRIYIDANRNGDLTDDPRVAWESRSVSKNPATGEARNVVSGLFLLPVSWNGSDQPYGLNLIHAIGSDRISAIRAAARKGKVTIGSKSFDVLLVENAGLANFNNVAAAKARRPGVWLLIDVDADGTFKPTTTGREVHDTSRPIPIGDEWYAAEFSSDGADLSLYKTPAPPKVVEAPRNPLLKAGQKAPDFDFILAGGKKAKFSDYRGKVRILDMWATWCGPCLAAMPKVENVYQQVKDQGVVVLGLDVMDEPEAYEKWLTTPIAAKYHFLFGSDPAGLGHKSGGISGAWGVYAIPTTFLIDKDDQILLVLQGLSDANHAKLVQALNDKGIRVKIEKNADLSAN